MASVGVVFSSIGVGEDASSVSLLVSEVRTVSSLNIAVDLSDSWEVVAFSSVLLGLASALSSTNSSSRLFGGNVGGLDSLMLGPPSVV